MIRNRTRVLMLNDLVIRGYRPGDDENIVEHLINVFGSWPKFELSCSSVDYWRWKYSRYHGKKMTALAFHEDNVVGSFHSLPVKLNVGSSVFQSVLGADIGVHQDYRGMGVYGKLRDLSYSLRRNYGVNLHYAINENPILIKKRKQDETENPDMYLNFPTNLTRYLRIKDINLYLKENTDSLDIVKKIGYKSLQEVHKFTSNYNAIKIENLNIVEIKCFDKKLEDFFDSIRENYKFLFNRNRDYFNWRYLDERSGKHAIYRIEHNDEIKGLIVLKINKVQNTKQGYIVDLMVHRNDVNISNSLIEYAIKYFEDNEVNIILSLLFKDHPYGEMFKKNGFVPYNTYELNLTLFDKNPMISQQIRNAKSIESHFQYADLDYV